MRSPLSALAPAVCGLLMICVPAMAHHGTSNYETTAQIITLSGTVTEFVGANPHATDGRELPKDPDPQWMGYSVGNWEGDVFVVKSLGFREDTWLDHFGNP
jgi:hypothetical protein